MLHAKVEPQVHEMVRIEMQRVDDKKWYIGLKIIDLSSQGQKVSALAQLFDLSEATIRSYIHRFNNAGLIGLHADYGVGRPVTLTCTQAQWFEDENGSRKILASRSLVPGRW